MGQQICSEGGSQEGISLRIGSDPLARADFVLCGGITVAIILLDPDPGQMSGRLRKTACRNPKRLV